MNRRGFLSAMLAAGTAPAIVKASSLMPLWVPRANPYEIVVTADTITANELIMTVEEYYLRYVEPSGKELHETIYRDISDWMIGFRNGV